MNIYYTLLYNWLMMSPIAKPTPFGELNNDFLIGKSSHALSGETFVQFSDGELSNCVFIK